MSAKKKSKSLPIEVRRSSVHGRGVYATRAIAKGKRIIEYKGRRMSWTKADREQPADPDNPRHTFLFGLDNGVEVINAATGGNEARWINHSCEPNCEAIEEEERVFIDALRGIRAGEELFYDYALQVDEPRTRKLEREFVCHCGAPRCRGTMLEPAAPKDKTFSKKKPAKWSRSSGWHRAANADL